jgi:hypothetical protein
MVKDRRKKMSNKTKTKTQVEEFRINTDKPTPRYNKVKAKVNKLLGATLSYIEEACTELRKDWVPTMTDEVLKKNPGVQMAIRDRIYDDFAKERSDNGVWKESSILLYFPDWLRYESQQEANKGNLEKAYEAKSLKKFLRSADQQKPILDRVAGKLEEPPKEKEPEFEYPSSEWSLGPAKYHKLGGDTKTPLTKLGDIRDGCRELFTALTEKEHMPALSEDLENDFIKPTREYRKFIYELDEHEQAGLYNWLVITQAAISDMLNILDEAKGN